MSLYRQKSALLLVLALLLIFAAPLLAGLAQNLSAAQSRELLATKSEVFLLDVRTAEEHREVRIAGSHLIPIDQLLNRMDEIPKARPVLVYCAVGSRSSQVAGYLASQGYPEVYNMYGGIWGWQLRGLPILKGE